MSERSIGPWQDSPISYGTARYYSWDEEREESPRAASVYFDATRVAWMWSVSDGERIIEHGSVDIRDGQRVAKAKADAALVRLGMLSAQSEPIEHLFQIAIGDWSGDGHGRCEYVWLRANKPICTVREAYFSAKAKLPDVCPEKVCSEYEEHSLDEAKLVTLRQAGAPTPEDPKWVGPDDMTVLTIWFLQQGDPDLQLERVKDPPTLHFYGRDEQGRHVNFIGYGCFN